MKNLYKLVLVLSVLSLSLMSKAQTNPIYINFSCSGQSQPYAVPVEGTFNNRPAYRYRVNNMKKIELVYSGGVNGGFAWIVILSDDFMGFPIVVYYNTADTPEPPLGDLSSWLLYSGDSTCVLSQLSSTITTLAVNDDKKSISKIYPNPAKDFVTLYTTENVILQISDTTGRLVKTQFLNNGKNQINVSALPKGNYIFTTISKSGSQFTKVIKQ